MKHTIDICIATYKRKELLKNLLISISKLKVPVNQVLGVIVVDNDKLKSAEPIIKILKETFPHHINYYNQPIQNIALARNMAIDQSTAEYILFVDDDEIVITDWTKIILDAALNYNADVVFGPVDPIFSHDTPQWIIEHGYFKRSGKVTGQIMEHGPTGNTLVKRNSLLKYNLAFNPEFGLTGGSDIELFWRLHKKGGRLIWCNEALAYEHIPPHRTTRKWLAKRSFRGGQTTARVFLKDARYVEFIKWHLIASAKLFYTLVKLIFALLLKRNLYETTIIDAAGHLGKLTGKSGFIYKEYQTKS